MMKSRITDERGACDLTIAIAVERAQTEFTVCILLGRFLFGTRI